MTDVAAAAQSSRLPDFILIGAAKCGTTTLHRALAQHPGVYMPPNEIYFFDVDDILSHPDFFVHNRGLSLHDYERDFEQYLAWYRAQFAAARPDQLVGEDTTTYLASRHAARRIERLLPEVKLIVTLRDPVSRAYSQYWHDVRAGRRTLDFEGTLRTAPESVLSRGFYREQLERYRSFLQAGRLHVVFFEDLVSDTEACLTRVCEFLDIEPLTNLSAKSTHQNASRPPFNLRLRLLFNALASELFAPPKPIPNMPGYSGPRAVAQHAPKPHQRLALSLEQHLPRAKAPKMRADTRELLQAVYARHNAGLSELIGEDVAARWPYMEAAS